MVPPVNQTSGSLPPPSSQGSAGNIPTSSGSATANHQHQNAVSTTHTNGRVHPPLQERSRNARAQARHRAKRKAYISQLEETVTRLQAALSPYPTYGSNAPTTGANGSSSASPTDQAHSPFGNSPGAPANAPGNTLLNLGPSAAAAAGQGSGGPDGANLAPRLRAIELECQALRTYADTLRTMLAQHAPTVQVPPPPLPSSLPLTAPAAVSGPSSVHSNPNSGAGGGLPPLNSSFRSVSSASTTPTGPNSLSPGTYRVDSGGKVIGVKRPRHDSHSRSLSESGSGPERDIDDSSDFAGSGGNASHSSPKTTPLLSGKSNTFNMPTHSNFPANSFNNASTGGRLPPPLTLPPVPQNQHVPPPQPAVSFTNAHQTPLSAYPPSSNQSQQPFPPSLHQQQNQVQQPQSQGHAHSHSQPPQMTPMPPPAPPHWGAAGGVSSVPSHGNNNAPVHGLQLPPPIPRFGAAMPNLTRGFAYPPNASPTGTRPDGMDSSAVNVDRGRIGSLTTGAGGGAIGLGLQGSGNGMVLKREEETEAGLATNMYGSLRGKNAYAYPQLNRHSAGRHHQQNESIHSISPISATAASPSSTIAQHQEHYHSQIPSPHGQPHAYQHQPSSATQRALPSPVLHQHQQPPQVQGHYAHSSAPAPPTATNPHNLHLQPTQPHQHQQQSATTLTSPQSPYPPVSPSVSGPYRGYPEERAYHHHQSGPPQQHASAHAHHPNQTQSQNHEQNYIWTGAVHASGVYGAR